MGRNMLVEGEWHTDVEPQTDETGAFDRVTTTFREWIRDDQTATFQPASDRYHLYISRSCPWAHGTALVRRLTGLADVISMDVVDPLRRDEGWEFTPEKAGCTPDTVNDVEYLREVYQKADRDYTGRVTVPVLWDREEDTIVNNESIEIMRMLDAAFAAYDNGLTLYPAGYREDVDRIVEELYAPLNNGVYRAGFAESQSAYEDAVTDVFSALDHWDSVLADRRYLAGDRLTLADIRLFPTLIRFDEVYHTHFNCNKRFVHQYDNLWPYLRDLFQLPGVEETVNMAHIKEGYLSGGSSKGIIPIGPDLALTAPPNRHRFTGKPPEVLATTAEED